MNQYLPWLILAAHIGLILFIDFFILNKKDKVISHKKALYETLFFIFNAFVFSGVIYWLYNNNMVANPTQLTPAQGLGKYISGYLIELSLSVDNLFVIAIIFTNYKITHQYQHKLLFLGIVGAIVFRGILIFVGIALINKIHALNIVFGLFLLYTAIKMVIKKDDDDSISTQNRISKFFKISKTFDGGKFRTIVNGKKVFTPLFGALIAVELTDLLFALDSIPAIFSVTTDPFIVFSSNIFAIMGLRSLFYFLQNMLSKFHYLKYSVFAILLFVSIKLIATDYIEIPEWISLSVIGLCLGIGIWVSISKSKE